MSWEKWLLGIMIMVDLTVIIFQLADIQRNQEEIIQLLKSETDSLDDPPKADVPK